MTGLYLPTLLLLFYPGIEGGFDVEQEQYEEDIKVVILPDRQEVTSEDLATMPDVVRERVRSCVSSDKRNVITLLWLCLRHNGNVLATTIWELTITLTCNVLRQKTV